MMHFARTFLNMRAQGLRVIAIEEFVNYEKIVYIENIFENGWRKDAYPSSYPLDPHLAISNKNHHMSLAYFSHLVPLVLFFLTKKQTQKEEGGMTQCPP